MTDLENRYPHVAKALSLAWGTPLFAQTLQKYFMDTREHNRRGFPHDVAGILFQLMEEHDREFPHLKVKVWFNGLDLETSHNKD